MLKESIKLNNLSNIETARLSDNETASALANERPFRRLKNIDVQSYEFSHILVDPPRAGLSDETITLSKQFKNMIYISCNPETFLRCECISATIHPNEQEKSNKLLDEITSSLDKITTNAINSALKILSKNKTCLYVSHDTKSLFDFDKVILMKDGKIVDRGSPKELITKYGRKNLEEVFLEIARKEK